MSSDTIFTSSYSQQRWVNQIAKTMSAQTITIDIHETFAVSAVPETLISEKPEAYTPQHIGLGPYHHLRPSLYKLEFHKIAAVEAILSSDQVQNFQTSFIDKVKELEPRVRACYDRYLDLDSVTLSWIMAIDGLFLFTQLGSTTEEDIVRDVLMLENQIPTFVMTEMLTLADTNYNQLLNSKVLDFCELNSPLKLTEESRFRQAGYSHLLDRMYNLIVNNRGVVENSGVVAPSAAFSTVSSFIDDAQKVMDAAGGVAALAGVPQIKTFFTFIKTLPCDQFLSICCSSSKEDSKVVHIADEIKIPSVSQLCDVAKVKFCVTHGGIRDVKFDTEELTFHLPVITLNNKCSEAILRNLVAYEAALKKSKTGESLEMAEYVDLMCGIIDTAKDVELLRGNGIVVGDLGDEEIAKMFNGMNRTTGTSNGGRIYELEDTVEKVNKRFDKQPRVRIYRCGKNFMDKYVYGSWKMLVLLATIILLLLMVLQSFCSIYGCSNRFSLKMVTSV